MNVFCYCQLPKEITQEWGVPSRGSDWVAGLRYASRFSDFMLENWGLILQKKTICHNKVWNVFLRDHVFWEDKSNACFSEKKKSKKQACVLTARCAALKAPVDGAVSRGKMGKAAFPAQGHRAPAPSTASPQRAERTHLLVSYAWCTRTKPGLCVFALISCCFAPGGQSEAELTTELHPPPPS